MEGVYYLFNNDIWNVASGGFGDFVTVGESIKILNLMEMWYDFLDPNKQKHRNQAIWKVKGDILKVATIWTSLLATPLGTDWKERNRFLAFMSQGMTNSPP